MNNFTTLLAQYTTYSTTSSDAETATAASVVIAIVMILFWIVLIALMLTAVVFWWIAFIHVLSHDDVKDRVMWIVLLLAIGAIVGPVYYFAVQRAYSKGGARDPNHKKS